MLKKVLFRLSCRKYVGSIFLQHDNYGVLRKEAALSCTDHEQQRFTVRN